MKNNLAQESGFKYICLVCKEALSGLDLSAGYAVCGSCRKLLNPVQQQKDPVVKASPPIVVLVSDQQAFNRLARFQSWGR